MPDVPPEKITSTPETGDTNLGASVLLPHGGTLSRGQVTKCTHDQHGDVTGRAHNAPTLDTHEYEIEWDDGGMSATTSDISGESMYNPCDEDGTRVLLFDAMVAHRRCLTAKTLMLTRTLLTSMERSITSVPQKAGKCVSSERAVQFCVRSSLSRRSFILCRLLGLLSTMTLTVSLPLTGGSATS